MDFWRPPRSGIIGVILLGAVPLYLWYGILPVLLAVGCAALGFAYGRYTCNDADLDGHR